MNLPIYTYDPKKEKKVYVGSYDGIMFRKKVGKKHYMIKEKGYGIQEDVVQNLKELDCQYVELVTKTRVHRFPFPGLLEAEVKNYGHGKQRFLKVL